MRCCRFLALVVIALWAMPAEAQSLADIARKEQARRKQVQKAARVITNKDLRAVPPSAAPPPPAAAPAEAPQAQPAPEAPEAPVDEDAQREKDEEAWRSRMADARLALERSQMYADALQSKINALWADFTARDNPVERAQIEIERNKAIAELARVKGEVEAQTKAIADLEEEARRAGIPPGWIR